MSWKDVQYQNGKLRTNAGGGGGASSLSGLDDTEITNPSNGDTLKYNSTSQKWKNEENSLANLSDTSMLTLSDKQVLSYNGRTQKWENRSNSVSRLSDVSLNSPSDGDILRYNAQSGEWENTIMPDSYHVYSTTEKIVGEWTNRKPIYEKTYDNMSVTLVSGSYVHSGITISNVDKIITCVSAIDIHGQTLILSIGLYSNNELALYSYCGSGTVLEYLTVQYTKNTD